MEEKKRNYNFPWWIRLIVCAIIGCLLGYTCYLFDLGRLTTIGFGLSQFSALIIAAFYYMFEESFMESMYQDEIDDLESEINTLDQENNELRSVIKNYSKDEKKSSKKTKKENECKD